MLRRTFKYRCYPSKGTQRRARALMRGCARVYNNALAERYRNFDAICVAKDRGEEPPKWVSAYDQYSWIRKRDHPELAKFPTRPLQVAVAAVDASFKSFRALHKNGGSDAKPPNQMTFCRWATFRPGGWRLEGHRLYLSKLGADGTQGYFPLRLHRPIEGKIKCVTLYEKNRKWYACFSCEVPRGVVDSRPDGPPVDLAFLFWDGLFLSDSLGRQTAMPQFYWAEIDTLRRLSRALSRKKVGSVNRRKARALVAKWHEHIVAKRDAWLWQLARFYASSYQRITVPEWPLKEKIQYALTHQEARKLCDASYGRFIGMLRVKCEEFGTELISRRDEAWEAEVARLAHVARNERDRSFLRDVKRAIQCDRRQSYPKLATQCQGLMIGV